MGNQMKFPLGREGQLLIGAPEDSVATMDEATNARDVSYTLEIEEAEMNARGSGQWDQNRPITRSLEIEFELRYEPGDDVFEALRDAALENGLVEAAALHKPHDEPDSEGPKGQFFVSNFGGNQPLREGQRIPVTLQLFEFDEWYEGGAV